MHNVTSSPKLNESSNTNFAEVVESSISKFTAQCWEWDQFPTFGSLVQVKSKKNLVYGVVVNIHTGSHDSSRTPFAYRKTEEELKAEHPQIFELLQTTFVVQILGYASEPKLSEKVSYILPPEPCKIHEFVHHSPSETYELLAETYNFLPLLFSFRSNVENLDELILAMIREFKLRGLISSKMIGGLCDMITTLGGNDYKQTRILLKRIQQILT
jgi:hypothetical protein